MLNDIQRPLNSSADGGIDEKEVVYVRKGRPMYIEPQRKPSATFDSGILRLICKRISWNLIF